MGSRSNWGVRASAGVVAVIVASGLGSAPAEASIAAPAAALAAWSASWAHLPDSAAVAGTPVAAGTLVDAKGNPVANSTIVLTAEPSPSKLAALSDGQSVPTTEISRATTDSAGRWSLAVPAGTDLTSAVSATDGSVNFDVNAMTAGGAAPSFFSAKVPTGQGAAAASADTSRVVKVAGRSTHLVASSTASMKLSLKPLAGSVGKAAPSGQLKPQDTQKGLVCYTDQVSDLGSTDVVIGATFSENASVAASSFTYGQGQSSTLGVAVSASGAFGSFSASTTHTIGSSAQVGFGSRAGVQNLNYHTNFDYRKYHYHCTYDGSPNGQANYYYVQAADWYGGATVTGRGTIAAGYCDLYGAGTMYTNTSTTASTFATGVNLTGDIGISLTAQTGYTSTATIVYRMGNKAAAVCGMNAHGAVTANPGPGLVQVH